MKSLLPQAFFVPDVHPRPRKRPPRCTLDCGFKTSESPALRGFVAGPWALATAALYLVIFSNGLHRSKNLPVKFGFSPKTVSANIARKLPSQRCSKPLLIPFFNFSHKWPTFAFTPKAGTHSPFRERSHTAAHTPKQGPSLPRPQCGFVPPAKYLDSATLLYTYISRFSVAPTISNSSTSDHLSSRFSTSRTNGPRSLSQAKVGTHSAL